jgi:hypothetical protein
MATRAVRALQPPGRPLTISEAAGQGNRRDLLVALRDRIAQALENQTVPGRDLASLSLRLLEIAKEIEAIDAEGGGDNVGHAAATPDEEWASSRDADVGSGADDPPE